MISEKSFIIFQVGTIREDKCQVNPVTHNTVVQIIVFSKKNYICLKQCLKKG